MSQNSLWKIHRRLGLVVDICGCVTVCHVLSIGWICLCVTKRHASGIPVAPTQRLTFLATTRTTSSSQGGVRPLGALPLRQRPELPNWWSHHEATVKSPSITTSYWFTASCYWVTVHICPQRSWDMFCLFKLERFRNKRKSYLGIFEGFGFCMRGIWTPGTNAQVLPRQLWNALKMSWQVF